MFANNGSGCQPDEIAAAWHGLTAAAVDGQWVSGKTNRPVADWRSALADELWKRKQIYGSKNSARATAAKSDGESPQPLDTFKATLDHVPED